MGDDPLVDLQYSLHTHADATPDGDAPDAADVVAEASDVIASAEKGATPEVARLSAAEGLLAELEAAKVEPG